MKKYVGMSVLRKGIKTTSGGRQSPATRLEHEFDHAVDYEDNAPIHRSRQKQGVKEYDNMEEFRVITGSEKKTAKANKESIRFDHRGKAYDVISPISTKEKFKNE